MKTKTIPFDLETAKKIQAGEIEGKVYFKTKQAYGDETYTFNLKSIHGINNSECPYYGLFECNGEDCIQYIKPNGYIPEQLAYLIIEVPDNGPQFKVGDNVRIRPDSTHGSFVREHDGSIGKIVGTHHEFFVVVVTGSFQGQFKADELELVEETGKHEFKPFDKVLVRNDINSIWQPSIFSYQLRDCYYTVSSYLYKIENIIPYEGNQDLVGTTNKPKEE